MIKNIILNRNSELTFENLNSELTKKCIAC